MKKLNFVLITGLLVTSMLSAQFRSNDQSGLNVFETQKTEIPFNGVKVKMGGGFT